MAISKSLLAAAAGIEIPHEETENLNYQKHEFNIFPEIKKDDQAYQQLKESIQSRYRKEEPLIIYEGKILDGWNRYLICKELDVQATTRIVNFSRIEAIEFIKGSNARRDLINKDQRTAIYIELHGFEMLEVAENEKKKKLIGNQNAKKDKNDDVKNLHHRFQDKPKKEPNEPTRKTISKATGLNEVDVQKLMTMKKNDPEKFEQVRSGEKNLNDIKKEEKKEKIEAKLEEIKAKAEINQIPNNIKLLEGDLFDHINSIPDNSIDLLNTDPPYKILGNDWDQFKDENEFFDYTEKWLRAVIPKVKSTGRIYISFAQWYQYDFYQILKSNDFFGFNFKQNIIWYYKNNNKPSNQKEYRYMYEPIFYLYGKDAPNLNFTPDTYGETHQNVWEIATPQSNFNEGKYHSAQKPLELYRRIIKTGSFDNDYVLDCFAGSGTTGIICKELNRNCILIERDIENIKIIKGRI